MARMKFLCDADRCIECNACVTACKNENEVPWGINRRRVVTINDGGAANDSLTVTTASGCAFTLGSFDLGSTAYNTSGAPIVFKGAGTNKGSIAWTAWRSCCAVARPSGAKPTFTATPVPPLDPPGDLSGSTGLRASPKPESSDVVPNANSWRLPSGRWGWIRSLPSTR